MLGNNWEGKHWRVLPGLRRCIFFKTQIPKQPNMQRSVKRVISLGRKCESLRRDALSEAEGQTEAQFAQGTVSRGPSRKAVYTTRKHLDTILRIIGSHWRILIRTKTSSDFYYLILWRICFFTCKKWTTIVFTWQDARD